MKDDQIREFMRKYWDGDTSLREEELLRDYFKADEVAPEFESFRPLFVFFGQSKKVRMQTDIDLPQIDEKSAKNRIIPLRWLRNVAAGAVLLIGLLFLMKLSDTPSEQDWAYEDTFEDPEIAYQELRKAIYFMSSKMNTGIDQTTNSIEKMEPLIKLLN